jgi:hypothetical protein
MALPELHPLNEVMISCESASIGATPANAYMRVPVRGKIIKVGCVTKGAITTADGTETFATNNTGSFANITGGAVTVTVSGAAAGQHFSAVPTAANDVNEDDVVRITPSGASGSSIGGFFYAVIRRN